jgi:hypothetical protein
MLTTRRRNPPTSAARGTGTYTSLLPAIASSSTVSTSRNQALRSDSSSSRTVVCHSCRSRVLCLSILSPKRIISKRCRSAMDATPPSRHENKQERKRCKLLQIIKTFRFLQCSLRSLLSIHVSFNSFPVLVYAPFIDRCRCKAKCWRNPEYR